MSEIGSSYKGGKGELKRKIDTMRRWSDSTSLKVGLGR